MVKTLTINGKTYTAHVEVVRESDEIKARAARERLSEYGAYLAEQIEARKAKGRDICDNRTGSLASSTPSVQTATIRKI